jgi:CheY-like chemotaxis protein
MTSKAARSTVLVVESDAVQRDLIVMAIERLGCEVFSTSNAFKVLELCEEHHPKVLLMDVYLPQKNGFEVLQNLKKKPIFAELKVIMISAMGFSEVVNKAVELGAKDFW